MLTHYFHYKTSVEPDYQSILNYIDMASNDLKSASELSESLKCKAINNLVYSMLQFDQLDRAKEFINQLSRYVHEDAYATATLGLYHIKNGNIEKGVLLYDEASEIVSDKITKGRIKQRKLIEQGFAGIKRIDRG